VVEALAERGSRRAPLILVPKDAVRFGRLRARMLAAAPWAFSADVGDGQALDEGLLAEMLAEQNHVTLAIEEASGGSRRAPEAELVGTASITRSRQPKFAHRARLWGVYVDAAHRTQGLGRALLDGAVERARSWGVDFVDLSVSANSPEAERLYRRAGFTAWGREPEATAWNGARYDEIHMTLGL
jgi:ribosomal protein S18 acetylase RimI-like enzyme